MARSAACVLVDLPNWLGDFVHLLPALRCLAETAGSGGVVAATPAAFVPLVRAIGAVPAVRTSRAAAGWAQRTLVGTFDFAVTARHSTRAKLLLSGSPARRRLASRGRGAALLGLETFVVDRSAHQRHDLDGALIRLGLPPADDQPIHLEPPSSWMGHAGRWRARFGRHEVLAALLPGSSNDSVKRYPIEAYRALARELVESGITPVMMGGPGEDRLAVALAAVHGVRIAPLGLSLDFAAAFLAACDVVVGNDSGLTHLAAAVGCPTVALYGPTDAVRTAPVGGATILAVPRFRGERSWEELTPKEVARAVIHALDGARAAGRGLRDGEPDGMMRAEGGPLAQLAEQGTLNP